MSRLTSSRGLCTSPSELTVPDGALVVADNTVIDLDNIVQQRRGFAEYGSAFSTAAKQLTTYKNTLLVHHDDKLSFDNGSGAFVEFSGDYSELVPDYRIKSLETSGNLYFTTDNGIKKLSVEAVADLSTTTILNAGAAKAVDLSGVLVPSDSGFLPAQSKVAYRMVFGYTDASGNLILGSPSASLTLTNQSADVEQSEIFTVTVATYGSITAGEYFLFSTMDTDYFVWFNVSGTDTEPVSADTIGRTAIEVDISGLASNALVAGAIAQALSISAADITVVLDGAEVEVTVVTAGNATDAEQGTVASADVLITKVFDGSITTGTPANASLTFTLPPDVDTTYFYQMYRTGYATATEGVTLNDIDPGDEQYFIFEYPVTAANVSAGSITVSDITPDSFRASGAYLYTNAITGGGRGIIDANERPPIALDIASFRSSTFYANTKDIHRYTFNMLSVDDFVSGTTKFFIGKEDTAFAYTFKGAAQVVDLTVVSRDLSVGNSYTVVNSASNERSYYLWVDKGIISHSFNSTSDVDDATEYITIASHGFANGDAVVASGTLPAGLTASNTYYVISRTTNTFQLALTAGGSAINLTDAVGTGVLTHTPADPAVSGKLGIRIPLELYANTTQGSKDAILESLLTNEDFEAVDYSASVVRITNSDNGNATTASASSPNTWSISTVTAGDGEDAASREVLLSESTSTGIAIDLTARSLVRVINQDSNCPVTASYLSGTEDLPGRIILEAKVLEDVHFYVSISTASLSAEFSPELAVDFVVTGVNATTNVFTTSAAHGLVAGDIVYVNDNPNGTVVEISGVYTVATAPTTTTFTLTGLDVLATQAGITGAVFKTTSASDNNVAPNRLYFSKANQPEAVPSVNYIDIGSKDKEILRILALRDNLFVLKDDGIYIVTGASAPNFSVRLLDNSAILIAPDSAVVLNNLIYCLSSQGVISISDSGVSIVSRQIENLIKKVTTFNYDFRYTSFGVSYESDRAYLLWLPTTKLDTVATQCFRYSTITNTWTRWTKSNTCGLVNSLDDDRMYLGAGDDRDLVEQERKNGERQDYADRDFIRTIGTSAFDSTGLEVVISSTTDVEAGDVMVQSQYVSITKFNRLLNKLDEDSGTDTKTYYDDLNVTYGVDLGNALVDLVAALNADTGLYASFTVPSGSNTLLGLQTDYNLMIDELNDVSSGTILKDYATVTDLLYYEVLIEDVLASSNLITVNTTSLFIQGNVTIYKAIQSEVQWAPQHFGAPEVLKQIHEGTLMFDQSDIYGGVIAFSSDRSADFKEIEFELDGPGFWAAYNWGEVPWGGEGNGRPVRTLVPMEKSRCRYLNVKFRHFNARESYKLIGMSLTPREVSTRAYR